MAAVSVGCTGAFLLVLIVFLKLLQKARIESEKMELDENYASVRTVVKEIYDVFEPEAIRALTDQKKAKILIIAMTANAFSEDIQHSLAAGMNAHISKPVDMKTLEKTIRNIKYIFSESIKVSKYQAK